MINKRIFEIDLLKVTALILMITFHIVYDLNEFVSINLNYSSGFWYILGRISALLFIFLAGINSGFSNRPIRRGIIVFSCGLVVTVITFLFMGDLYVRFGILHFLGVNMILFPLLKRFNSLLLLLIAISILIASKMEIFNNISLIVFLKNIFGGLSIDYYPLFPYLSIFIFGVIMYKIYYYRKKSIFNLYVKNKLLYLISKYSLSIYLIHQPIVLGIILLFKLFIALF
jgi:uncharacterized membrane protein